MLRCRCREAPQCVVGICFNNEERNVKGTTGSWRQSRYIVNTSSVFHFGVVLSVNVILKLCLLSISSIAHLVQRASHTHTQLYAQSSVKNTIIIIIIIITSVNIFIAPYGRDFGINIVKCCSQRSIKF